MITARLTNDKPYVKAQMEACPTCDGHKKLYTEELVDYHRGEYRTLSRNCYTCDGTGMMVRITAKINTTTEFISDDGPVDQVRQVIETSVLLKSTDPDAEKAFT